MNPNVDHGSMYIFRDNKFNAQNLDQSSGVMMFGLETSAPLTYP